MISSSQQDNQKVQPRGGKTKRKGIATMNNKFQQRILPDRRKLALSIMLAMAGSQAVMAQDDTLEEITVTGSRIERSGMTTPTPVTSVSSEELSNMAPGAIIQALNQLPQFYGNTSIEDAGFFFTSPGSGNLNMRGLGTNRTLVLLNGKRAALIHPFWRY